MSKTRRRFRSVRATFGYARGARPNPRDSSTYRLARRPLALGRCKPRTCPTVKAGGPAGDLRAVGVGVATTRGQKAARQWSTMSDRAPLPLRFVAVQDDGDGAHARLSMSRGNWPTSTPARLLAAAAHAFQAVARCALVVGGVLSRSSMSDRLDLFSTTTAPWSSCFVLASGGRR